MKVRAMSQEVLDKFRVPELEGSGRQSLIFVVLYAVSRPRS
jgi:hypothetical protein